MTSTLNRDRLVSKSLVGLTSRGSRRGNDFNEANGTKKAIENAESRANDERTKKKNGSKIVRRNDREYADALHREADQLYQGGDYETALVLYHRAASTFPRDGSHIVAARRTAMTISMWTDPPKRLKKHLSVLKGKEDPKVAFCPETAATRVADVLKKSPNPLSVIEVLRYLEPHKELWNALSSRRTPSKSRLVRKDKVPTAQSNDQAMATLKTLETAFRSGDTRMSLMLVNEVLRLSTKLADANKYQAAAYHYLALIHVSLGRHDKAVDSVSMMIYLSKISGDTVLISRSLVTLGKVHLSFGHLDAAARAWENLSENLAEPIPRAWIHHEIGRCYLETGRHSKALDMAFRCLDEAKKANSKKWILRGKLLAVQALVNLNRLTEALTELTDSERITEEEGDTPTLSYVRDAIAQVKRFLSDTEMPEGDTESLQTERSVLSSKEDNAIPEKRTVLDRREDSEKFEEEGGSLGKSSTTRNLPDLASVRDEKGSSNDGSAEEQRREDALHGNRTFRLESSDRSSNEDEYDQSLLLFTSSSGSLDDNDNDEEEEEEEEQEEEEEAEKTGRTRTLGGESKDREDAFQGGDTTSKRCDSATSLRSETTNITYVIDDVEEKDVSARSAGEARSARKKMDAGVARELSRDVAPGVGVSEDPKDIVEADEEEETTEKEEPKNEGKAEMKAIEARKSVLRSFEKWRKKAASREERDALNDILESVDEDNDKLMKIISLTLSMAEEDVELLESRGTTTTIEEVEEEIISSRSFDGRTSGDVVEVDSISGGKARGKMAGHSLYRHSLPSSPRRRSNNVQRDEVVRTYEGFAATSRGKVLDG